MKDWGNEVSKMNREVKTAPLRRRAPAVVMAVLLALGVFFAPAGGIFAYFDRGPVDLVVAQTSVSVNAGSTATVTVNAYPVNDPQTPGCGMEECPQICADLGCFDDIGQCICAGSEYTYYSPNVAASSSDSSVAQVNYSDGALTVTGVSPGTATVLITASMRQFRDSQADIAVTVAEAAPPPSSGGGGSSGSSGGSSTMPNPSPDPAASQIIPDTPSAVQPETNTIVRAETGAADAWRSQASGEEAAAWNTAGTGTPPAMTPDISSAPGSAAMEAPTEPATAEETEAPISEEEPDLTPVDTDQQADAEDGGESISAEVEESEDPAPGAPGNLPITTMTGRDGVTRTIADIGAEGVDVREILAQAAGKDETVTFRELDAAGNVRYSFSFQGKDLKQDADFDINLRATITEGFPAAKDALVLSFDTQKPLPAPAKVYVAAGRWGSGALSSLPVSTAVVYAAEEAGYTASESGAVNVYRLDAATGEPVKIADAVPVTSGYVSFFIDSTDDLIITTANLSGGGTAGKFPTLAVIAVIVIVLAAGGFYISRKRSKRGNEVM